MADQEAPDGKPLSKEDRLLQYLESEIGEADRSKPYTRMSPEGCAFAGAWLIAKSAKRQEGVLAEISAYIKEQKEISTGILSESKLLRRLTKVLIWLTLILVALTLILIGLTYRLLP